MTRKTYIGTPHRDSVSGQSRVTVCDGQKSEPLPLRLDLFNPQPGLAGAMAAVDRLSWPLPFVPMRWLMMIELSGCIKSSSSTS
jgi:hypothetical protein